MHEVLAPDEWRRRREAHEQRVDRWTAGHRERRRRGEAHPVEDFLFTYYSQSPARLRRWSPGPHVVLVGCEDHDPWVPVDGGVVLGAPPPRVVAAAAGIADLLERTASRPAQLGCFGLHEWAMVYRLPQEQVRHSSWPLRLGRSGTDAVVEGHALRCTHVDAFRFFTDAARPLNALQLTRADQVDREQPGCLHAGMDLYRCAYRLSPWVASELVADCFDLARRIRVLDMRASPYDFRRLGLEPVAVETPEGKAEYVAQQRAFAVEAAELRRRLLQAVSLVPVPGRAGASAEP